MEAQMQRPVNQHIEGESNQSGEKKSVMKKVKDKAKKIKDTFKKQSRGQGQEQEYRYDENPNEEDDDDEEIANDREIHGAKPTHDSIVISSTNLPTQPDQNLVKATDTQEDRYDPMVKGEAKARPNFPDQTGREQEMPPENKHIPSPMKPSSVQREEANAGEPEVKLGPSMGLEEDPHSPNISPGEGPVPPPKYESKVSDSTGDGGKESGVTPLNRRFNNLNVGDESETNPEPKQRPFTGSHEQFSPQPTPTQDELNPESNTVSTLDDNPESDPKSFDSNQTEGMPRDTMAGKVSSATSALSDTAIASKNMVASKLGYGGDSGHPESNADSTLENNPESDPKSFDSNQTEDMPPDTISGKVSSATSALSDKAIASKNMVASKLGYGGDSGQEGMSPSNKPESETTPGYTQKVSETLNPVYEKVSGAGTAVLSKFQGGGETGNQGREAAATGTDKGVSRNDYLAEKLKPGEEDKALSEAITDSLQKKKEGYFPKTGEENPTGKLTQSDEVAANPGADPESKRVSEDVTDAGRENSGPGIVGRVKDVVGSWLGKGTGTNNAQESCDSGQTGSVGQGDGAAGEQPTLKE